MASKNYNDNKIKLSVDVKNIEPIVCDGFIFPMHSHYVFELKKVYTAEPERQLNGQINYFAPKFFVPYFTIRWDILTIEQFVNISRYVQKNEILVEYYDTFSGSYKKDMFYAQQPTYSEIICKKGNYEYIKGLEIVFASTLSDRAVLQITFDANGGVLKEDVEALQVEGINGEEFIFPNPNKYYNKDGYSAIGWALDSGATNPLYIADSVGVIDTSKTLYAVWKSNS